MRYYTDIDRVSRGPISSIGRPVRKLIAIFLLYISVILCDIFIENRHLRDGLTVITIISIYNLYIYIDSKKDIIGFLYPSSFGINYIYISLIIGSFGFYYDQIVVPHMITIAPQWGKSIIPNLFLASVIASTIAICKYSNNWAFWEVHKESPAKIMLLIILLFLAMFLYVTTGIIFGEQIIVGLFCIYILYVIGCNNITIRLILYIIAFIPFSLAMSHSKREAVFLLYTIILLEVIMGKWGKVDFRRISLVFLAILALSGLILVMTVVRAAEVYGVSSIGDIIPAVRAYLQWGNFIAYFLLNIEATYTYFHVYNALDMAVAQIPVLWGETYIKPLFIWLPRTWVEWKPNSAVDVYTTIFDPQFRALGGSWAISMLGEAYLNFKMFGAIVLAMILGVFDRVFRTCVLDVRGHGLVYCVGAIYFGPSVLNFARGSGLDLALILFIVVVATAVPFAMVLNYRSGLKLLYIREPVTRAGKVVRHVLVASRSARR